jgi:ATP-dependent helicase IRC3
MQAQMRLRGYQREWLAAIFDRYKAGAQRQLICLPTGTGRTVIFAQFPWFFRMKRRMLILAHREELLNQARDKLLAANPALIAEIEQAGRSASESSNVVIASVPTIGRRSSRRLARVMVEGEDERAVSETAEKLASFFK